ncbi:S-adenosyl-L-methionine-dependent methyltransferase [Myxozyma melibiosi]|uniref:S-adenosyl-L-methionine-dependent methyltransferase n=1 Tax=Myxozyma melibiosi TaxID=54550 RepID=A0ABR1EYW7_9ASCO
MAPDPAIVPLRDSPYAFEHSAEETERLAFQHAVVSQIIGGRFLPAIDNFAVNAEFRILDCGSGSGSWANDLAFALPRSTVIGFDMHSIDIEFAAPNVRFEIIDANKYPFPLDDSSFDIIHSRSFSFGITDWPRYIAELRRLLKPDGTIHFIESVFPELVEAHSPHLCEIYKLLREQYNINYYIGHTLENLMPDAGLTAIIVKSFTFTYGPYGSTDNERRIGELMRSLTYDGARTIVRAYVAFKGLSEEEAKPYYDDAVKLFEVSKKVPGYIKYVVAAITC